MFPNVLFNAFDLPVDFDATKVYEEAIVSSQKYNVPCPIILIANDMEKKYLWLRFAESQNHILMLSAKTPVHKMVRYTAKAIAEFKDKEVNDDLHLGLIDFPINPVDMRDIYQCSLNIVEKLKIKCPQVFPITSNPILGGCTGCRTDGKLIGVCINTGRVSQKTIENILAHEMRHIWQRQHHWKLPDFTQFRPESLDGNLYYLLSPGELDAEAFALKLSIVNDTKFYSYSDDPIYLDFLIKAAKNINL